MSGLDSINDKCWGLLDWLWDKGVPIGAVFEKYNLPAVLFPLLIVLIVLLAFWMTSAPSSAAQCGDGVCAESGEDCLVCPEDCGACGGSNNISDNTPTDKISVVVELSDTPSEEVNVLLLDKDDTIIDTKTGRRSTFTFDEIEPQVMQASIVCPNGKSQTARPRSVEQSNNNIFLSLPSGCSTYLGDEGVGQGDPIPTYGTVRVTVKDSTSGETIDAKVNLVRKEDDINEDTATTIGGEAVLNPRADNRYYLTASKSNYFDYNGDDDVFYMVAGATLDKDISLIPLTVDPDTGDNITDNPEDTGTLIVCASSGSDDMGTGTLVVNEVGGNRVDSAHLTPSDNGCISFEIDSGKNVRATLINPPSACISPDFSDDVRIEPAKTKTVYLDVDCGNVGYVKVIVKNKEGDIMTQDAVVTLWDDDNAKQIPGTASDSSLAVGDDGYTEEITVPAETNIHALASDVPLGYQDTESQQMTISANGHNAIHIILAETPTEDFSFNGATLVYSSVFPNMPVEVFIDSITYNQTELTDENSKVTMRIGNNIYAVKYEPESA